jgi:methylation protein EvaC
MSSISQCRVCKSRVDQFLDLGRQPLSDAFRLPDASGDEFFYALEVGLCDGCGMVQLMREVPREKMFHRDYPYFSSGSSVMRAHFEHTARTLLDTELTGPDPFIVEIGCNDGVMLSTIAAQGVRHLGVEPSSGVAEVAATKGVRIRTDFFEHSTAVDIAAADGPADVVYSANTICHIPYLDSVFRGLDALLREGGIFVFEDPYWGAIVEQRSFDQIYDEHFYFFTAQSVRAMARQFGFDLVDVQRLGVHGGEIRYTVARFGERAVSPSVDELIADEQRRELDSLPTARRFAAEVRGIRDDLVELLRGLTAQGHRVVGYGATAKSATVANYCGLGPELISFVSDTTAAKQGRLTPGSHIPVVGPEAFRDTRPEYALLFAWNHADEIMAKEKEFRAGGGRWIQYVPAVHTS